MIVIGFVEKLNTQQFSFLSLFELESHPFKFSSWTIQSH